MRHILLTEMQASHLLKSTKWFTTLNATQHVIKECRSMIKNCTSLKCEHKILTSSSTMHEIITPHGQKGVVEIHMDLNACVTYEMDTGVITSKVLPVNVHISASLDPLMRNRLPIVVSFDKEKLSLVEFAKVKHRNLLDLIDTKGLEITITGFVHHAVSKSKETGQLSEVERVYLRNRSAFITKAA